MERLLAGNNNVMDIVNRIKRDGICILRNYVNKKLLKKSMLSLKVYYKDMRHKIQKIKSLLQTSTLI